MNSKEIKTQIFHLIIEAATPLGVNDILKMLNSEYSERTVRRWMSSMIQEGLIEKIGDKKGTKYQKRKNSENVTANKTSYFNPENQLVIKKILQPLYAREPINYREDWLNDYRPNRSSYLSLKDQQNLQEIGQRSKKHDPAGTYAHQIFNRLLIDISYNSSRLEGNTYSLIDTERLICEGTEAEGKLEEEKIMILNHKEAIRYLVDNAAKLQISEQTICTIHYLLSDGLVERRYSGKIRDHAVRIGGSTYIPLEEKKSIQNYFNILIDKAFAINNPFEQSFFLLVHLTYLQAFSDVNKRTARLCANIPLIQQNFVPQSFNGIERDDYISAVIAIYELQNVRPLVDLFLFSYKYTCSVYDSTLKAVGYDEIRVRYRSQRRQLIREIIVNKLIGDQMNKYIYSKSNKMINFFDDISLFVEDTLEDLNEIDGNCIAGLGITLEELNEWLQLRREH